MTSNEKLLKAIRLRQQKHTEFAYGILTADRYVRTFQDVMGVQACYKHFCQRFKNWASFDDVLKKAANTLVYGSTEMEVKAKQTEVELPDGVELPKNTLMVFRHVLTTSKKDRDGDVLRTDGAKVDPKMLLLYQHVHTLPIGKMLVVTDHTKNRMELISAIVDINELSHDSAVMVDNDMGRFSHGFRALDFREIKEGRDGEVGGFDVKKFEIMEESLVSVPANPDAETNEVLLSLVEGGKLTSALMKDYGKSIRDKMAVSVPVRLDFSLSVNGKEVESYEDKSGNEEGRESAGASEETDGKAVEEKGKEEGTEAAKVKTFTGSTGETKGHTHTVNLDDEGNGKTGTADGHAHGVAKFVVGQAGGHVHELNRAELEQEKSIGRRTLDRQTIEKFEESIVEAFGSEKRGRVLSKANEGKIREAIEDIKEAAGSDGVSRPIKALLRQASSSLSSVLKALETEEGVEGKDIQIEVAVDEQPTVKEAMAIVLSNASNNEFDLLKTQMEAIQKAKQASVRTLQYSQLLGR